jgi:hypothetical protein
MIYFADTNIHATRPHYTTRGSAVEFEYDVEGRAGYYLQCDPVAGITVEARVEGAGSWTDLEATPIDLEPYIGLRQRFEFKITPVTYTEDWRTLIRIFAGKL